MPDAMNTYWYAFITATPDPEAGEAVNVGLVLGNGKVFRLEYERELPRLAGIVAPDEIGIYEAMLRRVAEWTSRGVELPAMEAVLGPQLRLSRPRALLLEPTEDLIRTLRQHYLATPDVPYAGRARLLRERAERELDKLIERTKPPRLDVVRKATPGKLYEAKLDRYVHYRIPSVARAVRGTRRDLLVDSVLIEPHDIRNSLRSSAFRISRAFYAFGKIESVIRSQAGREIRRVGILYPGEPDQSADVQEARDWVTHILQSDTDHLIDGDKVDVVEGLAGDIAWAAEAA